MDTPEDEVSLVDIVKSSAKSHLFNDLEKLEGPKLFVWEAECMRQIDKLGLYNDFNTHQGKYVMLPDKPEQLNDYLNEVKHIFFIIPPLKKYLLKVFACLGAKLNGIHSYHVRILTRIPKQLQELFDSDEHVRRRAPTLLSWPFYWSPTFGDFVLNDFTHTGPSRLMLAENYEMFFLSACALNSIFSARQFYWSGKWAKQVVQNCFSLKQSSSEPSYVFDQIVVVDRLMDPVTPLLEQYSFAGMLDTLFGIGIKNVVEVPEELLKETHLSREGPLKKISLDTDVYRDLIHLSNDGAATKIQKIISELHKIEETHRSISSVSDVKRYMPMLSKLVNTKQTTSQAVSLMATCQCFYAQPEYNGQIRCEMEILAGNFTQSTVIEYIEELIIDGGQNAIPALRLIALQSLVYNGLNAKTWNDYQKLLVQSFGPAAVAWCLNLQISGLVYVAGSLNGSPFTQISNELKRMRCVVEQDALNSFYVGYVPLIVRFLDLKIRENWRGFETRTNERLKDPVVTPNQTPKRALYVIGGLTRSEISCIRALKSGFQCIFTTGILKTGDLVDFSSVL